MKKNSSILVFVAILALVVTSCNLQVNPSNGQQGPQPVGQPPQGPQPGGPQPGGPQPGGPQPGGPQPGGPQPGGPLTQSPQPGEQPQPTFQPSPQPTTSGSVSGGCAGAPVIPYFNASSTSITSGQSVTLSWGNVTNGSTGPMVGSTKIEPGLGEVGSGASSRTVKPTTTTTYTLTGTGCGGTTSKQVTVTVTPAKSGGGSIQITPLVAVKQVLDMAIINIFARSGDGHIMFTVKNSGNAVFTSGGFTYSCSGTYVDAKGVTNSLGPTSGGIPAFGGILKDPGDWSNYDTSFVLTSTMTKTRVKCVLDETGLTGANSANNTLSSALGK